MTGCSDLCLPRGDRSVSSVCMRTTGELPRVHSGARGRGTGGGLGWSRTGCAAVPARMCEAFWPAPSPQDTRLLVDQKQMELDVATEEFNRANLLHGVPFWVEKATALACVLSSILLHFWRIGNPIGGCWAAFNPCEGNARLAESRPIALTRELCASFLHSGSRPRRRGARRPSLAACSSPSASSLRRRRKATAKCARALGGVLTCGRQRRTYRAADAACVNAKHGSLR
eukprot:4219273-Pleurochrysis_carterae.AAC.2